MKTKMKNRIISALLAFALVLSILPEGVWAIDFNVSKTLTITASDDFSAEFITTAGGASLGTAYFALVPDIGVAANQTVSTLVNNDDAHTWTGFRDWLTKADGVIALTDTSVGCFISSSSELDTHFSNKSVTITQDEAGNLPDLADVYTKLKAVYGTEGFYVRGNSTKITDPATQLKDTGIPYVAVLFSEMGATADFNIALGTYKATVVGKSNLIPDDYLYKVASGTNFPVMSGDNPNLQFANVDGFNGSVLNDDDGNATFVKLTANLYYVQPNGTGVAVRPVDNISTGSAGRLILCSEKGNTATALKQGDTIEAHKEYFLAIAPTQNRDTNNAISTSNMPVNGYVKLEYYDSTDKKTGDVQDTRVVVIPVRIIGHTYTAAPSLAIKSGKMSGKKGELTVDESNGSDRHPVMMIGSGTTLTGPYRTTAQPVVVDQVANGKTLTTVGDPWVQIKAKEYSTDGNLLIANEPDLILEIEPTAAGNQLDPGSYVETLYYTYTAKSGTGITSIRTTRLTVYIEVEEPEVEQPTLKRQSGDKSDYNANKGASRQDPIFDYDTKDYGQITNVTLWSGSKTWPLNTGDWKTTAGTGTTGTLTLLNSALDKLTDLPDYSQVDVVATFAPPADSTEAAVTKSAVMNIKGSFPVTINVTTDIDNTHHGEITLVPVGGGTPITVQAAGTVNTAGATYTYTRTATKAGTTYTVCVDGNATSKTVSVDAQEATINYRTVTVHGDTSAGNVGIGTSSAAAQASATTTADKDLTVLIDLAAAQVVYLYAQPAAGYTGNATWSSNGDAVTGSPANAVTISKVTKTTTATASYDSFTAHVITKFADGSATSSTDVTSVKLCLADGSGEVAYDTSASSGNDWAFALSGTDAYAYAKVTTSSGTYVGALSGTLNADNQFRDLILYKVTTAKATTWPGGATSAPSGATDVNAGATATADTKNPAIAPEGAQVTMAATPDNGYTFKNWTGGTVTSGKYTVGNTDITLTANFEAIQVTLDDLGEINWNYGSSETKAVPATANKGTATSVSYAVTNKSALPYWMQATGVISEGTAVSIKGQPNKVEDVTVTVTATSSNGTTASKNYTIHVLKITPTLTLTGRGEPYYAGEPVPGTGAGATIQTVTLNNGTYYAGDPGAAYNASYWKTLALTDVTTQPTFNKSALVAGSNPITATLPRDQVPTISGSTAQLDSVWNAVTGSITLNVTAAVSVHVAVYKDTTTAYNIHAGNTVTLTDKTDSSKKFTGVIPATTGTDVTIPSVPSGTYTVTVGNVTGPDLTVNATDPTEYRLDYYTLTITSADTSKGTIVWTTGKDVTANGVYLKGTTFGVTATNQPGYHFTSWTKETGSQVNVPGSSTATSMTLSNTTIWTANFDPNTVTIIKNLNGAADSTTARTVELHLITSGTPAGTAAYTGTYTGATATIQAVANGTYAIYDAKGDTGLRVTVDSNNPAAVTIQYYTVKYAATPTNGSYTGTHADDEVISNGNDTRKTVNLHAVKPAANYAFSAWSSDPSCGTATTSTDASKVTTGTWKITSSPAAAAVATNAGILLTPSFTRDGGSIELTVKKDNVLQGSNATTAPSVTVKYSGALTGGGTTTGSASTDANGKVTFTDLKPGTYTCTINDGTRDWRDTTQFTVNNNDLHETVEYFTVTAVAESPSAASASVTAPAAGIVLKGKTATLTSSSASGYGGTVTWKLAKTNGDDKSSVSGNTVTVSDTVVATATYDPNIIKITVYKNGALVGENAKELTLYNGTIKTAFTGKTDANGVVTFTAVPVLPSNGKYTIYDGPYASPATTNIQVEAKAGDESSIILRYYDVDMKTPVDTSGTALAGTSSIAGTTTTELLVGGGARGQATVAASATNTDYAFNKWKMTVGTGNTEITHGSVSSGTYTVSTTTAVGRLVLTPVFEKTKATLTVTVTKNGQPVDGAEVFLDGTSKGTTGSNGKITITGLAAKNGYIVTSDVDSKANSVSANVTIAGDGTATLAYVTYTFNGNKPTDATGTVSAVPANGVVMVNKAIAWPGGVTLPGYTFKGWNTDQTDATAGTATWTASNSHTPTTAPTDGIIFYAAWTVNPLALTNGDYAATYGLPIADGTALDTKPTVTKPDSTDTITYKVSNGTGWANDHTIDGIKLTAGTSGWTISGTPNKVGTGSVTFRIQVTSGLTKQTAEADVVVSIAKAKIPGVVVTDVTIPTPTTNQDTTADLPTTNPGYVDTTTNSYGDEKATVTWSDNDDPFEYGKAYTASVTVKPDDNHEFVANPTGTVNGVDAKTVTKNNDDGTVTVTYTFPAVYQLVYSPNGGTGGTQPAPRDIKLGDTITLAGDPGYTRGGYNGGFGWATAAGTTATYTFNNPTNLSMTVDSTVIGLDTDHDGVITLYYVWQSDTLGLMGDNLVAVYDMNAAQWTATAAGTAKYQGRSYTGLKAPGAITVTGKSLDYEHLNYTLAGSGGFNPNDYFRVVKDSTTHMPTLEMLDGKNIPPVAGSVYNFTITVQHDSIAAQHATGNFTLTVKPIEIDHVALDAVTAPVQGAHPEGSVNKADNETTWPSWKSFYNTSGVSVDWAPDDDPYKKGQRYTATITLTPANTNYIFVQPDDKSTTGSVYAVGTDTVIDDTTTNPLGNWNHTLSTTQVVLTRTFPLTDISTTATLTATAWDTLEVSGFTANTQVPVNMYYLIYDKDMSATLDTAAKVKAAYDAAKAAGGTATNLITLGEKSNVSPNTSGVATYPGQPVTVTTGVVGDHTYYLYVVAEAASDTTKLATANDDALTPKKLTLTHNGYGSVDWTLGTTDGGQKQNTPAGPLGQDTLTGSYTETTANKSQVISMFQDSTFTATPANASQFGFAKWTLKEAADTTASNAGTGTTYDYKASGDGANTNDETLHAVFHRKITQDGFKVAASTSGSNVTYSIDWSHANTNIYIGAVKQGDSDLPAASDANYGTSGDTNTNTGIKYVWSYTTNGTTYTTVTGETGKTLTQTASDTAGRTYKLTIYYTDPKNGGAESSISGTTDAQTQKLHTPAPDLTLSTATDGGLDLSFPAITEENLTPTPVDHYVIELYSGATVSGSAIRTKTISKTDLTNGTYKEHWEANGTDIIPGQSYTVRVKAFSTTAGWQDSEWGTDTAEAGLRTLTLEDLAITIADEQFNGAPQTGVSAVKLKTDRVGNTITGSIGSFTATYGDTSVPANEAANKTHVNIAENTTAGPTSADGSHPYYVYIEVDQGTLYKALSKTLYTTLDGEGKADDPNTDWEIYQTTSTLNVSDISGAKDGVAVTLDKATVTYTTGASDIWNTGTGAAAAGNITRYFDLTYQVTASPNSAATDYDLTGNVFTPKVGGTYTIKVTAAYKVGADVDNPTPATKQFQADIALPQERTFQIETGLSALGGISAKWDRKADYGDSDSYKTKAGYRAADDTTDYYDASTAADAKTMTLDGLTFVLDWADGKADETIILGDTTSDRGGVWPGTITASNINGKTVTVDTANNQIIFPQAGETTLTFTYNSKSASVKYTLYAKKLTYTVTPGEKLWDSTNEANTVDAILKPTVVLDADQTYVTDTTAGTDTVTISAASYKYDNANAGDNKTITASGVKLGGDQAGFYTVDGTNTGTGKIRPRDIVNVTIKTAEPEVGKAASSKGVTSISGKDGLTKEGLTSPWPIVWQRWVPDNTNPDGGTWVDMAGTETFANQETYRPKVTVHADGNHILVLTRDDPAVDYTNAYKINDKYKGQIRGDGEEPDTPVEVYINGGDVAANEGVFYGVPISMVVNPELRFEDVKNGSSTDTRGPSTNVVRIVSINVGDPNPGTYTIDLGAYALPVYHTKISKPTGNLLEAGATITPSGIQSSVGRPSAEPGENGAPVMYAGDKLSTDGVAGDVYTLDLSGVDTSVEGTYTMTITARGDKDLGTGGAATGDGTAQATYTFALVVSKAAPAPVPTPVPSESIIVLYWISLKGKTNDLTGEKISSSGGRPTFVPKVIGLDGWVFKGWSETDPTLLKDGEKPELVDPLKISVTSDKIYYAYYEKEEVDHVHFVRGYPDGTFRPDNYITRAEVATIIARSCLEGFEEGKDYGNPGGYSDIGTKRWYTSAISYCSMAGVFTGYPDGTFRPNDYITRQELALVVGRLAGLRVNMGLPFEDAGTVNKWARDGVYTCYILGYVGGYNDGTFRPKNDITRAETVKIFNGYLNRGVDAKGLEGMTPFQLDASAGSYQMNGTTEYLTWEDVPEKHWAYYEIIEASNDHDFHWPEDENDTSKKDAPPEDWDAVYIEAEWRYRATYAITWSVSEGTVAETTTKVALSKAPVAPEVTPDEGRVFLGWSLTEGGEVVDLTTISITGAQTFYGIFADDGALIEPKTFTVSFETGEWADLDGESTVTVEENGVLATVPAAIAHEGYLFRGWSLTIGGEVIDPTTVIVTEDMTFFAVCEEKPAEPKSFTVTFVTGEQGDLTGETAVTVEEGTALTELPVVTAHEGYDFLGWSLTEGGQAVDPTQLAILEDTVFYALYEEQTQPEPEIPGTLYTVKAYIDGYEDGTFRPKEYITRATVASMIARAYGSDFDESFDYDLSAVSDITPDHPAAKAIGYCLEKGYFSGYPDGTFAPDGTMTRQEFAVVIAKLAGVQENQGLPFTDADSINKWARNYVYTVYVNGWITGYNDGTFKPKNLITRAEAVKIFNAFLGRSTTKESFGQVTEFDHVWSDFSARNWAYPDIMEATNDHTYYLNEDGVAIWVDPSVAEALTPAETQSPEETQTPEELQTPEEG